MYFDIHLDSPEVFDVEPVEQALSRFESSGHRLGCYARKFNFSQYWLPQRPVIQLAVVCLFARESAKTRMRFAVTDQLAGLKALLVGSGNEGIEQIQAAIKALWLELGQPVLLQTVGIPKPWGQEIWYTGIEARGVARFRQGLEEVPIPWILSVAGKWLLGKNSPELILLKVLDPLPDAIYGDLYYELHEQKQEVYVVTHVDDEAWSEGTGFIRLGFCPQKKAQYATESDFKNAFLGAIEAYELVRREIDDIFDQCRTAQAYDLQESVPAQELQHWQSQLPESLRNKEQDLRLAMESFSALRPLQTGDVVTIPCLVPHSLQHGVRVVEFQTPVYERKILSFAQKVLTQKHWDSREAVACMRMEHPVTETLEVLERTALHQMERVISFEDFEVHRLVLKGGVSMSIPPLSCYRLCLVVSGPLSISGSQVEAEQAVLIPASRTAVRLSNPGSDPVMCLLALPH